jgi:spartin
VTQDDVDTFETILAQCTAFLERAKPPMPARPGEKGSAYNPSDYAAGGRYTDEKMHLQHGEIVLVDEDNGSVVGELGQGTQVVESASLKPGSKEPVELELSADGKHISVRPVSEDYLRMARHPAYKDSSLVQNAATASRLLVTTTSQLGNLLVNRADSFTKTTKPAAKPMEFAPTTHERVRKINTFTTSVAGVSNKTVGQLSDTVQNFAARAAGKKKERPHKGYDEKGNPLDKDDYKPGFLNKSLIAFSTVMDGIATSGKTLLETSGSAASTVVGHKWGDEAGSLTRDLAGGVKNVGLVYIDVTGVSRRAVIKSVAKGMVIGKVRGGGEVVVGGGDGGAALSVGDVKQAEEKASGSSQGGFTPSTEPYHPVGFGSGAPPKYQEFGQPGAYPREKHG